MLELYVAADSETAAHNVKSDVKQLLHNEP